MGNLKKGFFLTPILALIPAISGNNRGGYLPFLKLSDLLLLFLTVYLVFSFSRHTILIDNIGLTLLIFTAVSLVAAIININQRTDMSTNLIIKSLLTFPQYLLAYLVAYWAAQKDLKIDSFIIVTLKIAAIVSAIAILQFVDFPSVRGFLSTFTGNPEIDNSPIWKTYRSTSIFYSWHALSMYLSINFFLGLYQLRKYKNRLLITNLLILIAMGFGTSLTISPFLLILLGLFHFKYLKIRTVFIMCAISFSVLAGATSKYLDSVNERIQNQFFNSNGTFQLIPQTISFRFKVWRETTVPTIYQNFWDGYGFSDEETVGVFRYSESMYFYLMLTGGFFLLVTFLMAHIYTLRTLWVNSKKDVIELDQFREMNFIILATLLFLSLIHPYFADTGPAFLYYILIGLYRGTATNKIARRYDL
jgi:hypothetical protein